MKFQNNTEAIWLGGNYYIPNYNNIDGLVDCIAITDEDDDDSAEKLEHKVERIVIVSSTKQNIFVHLGNPEEQCGETNQKLNGSFCSTPKLADGERMDCVLGN